MKPIPALIATLLLSACAVGPDYVKPAPEAALNAPFVAASPVVSADQPRGDWWRLFASPELDGLVTEALSANRDIAVAAANLAQVRASLDEVNSGRWPSTGLSASATRARQIDTTTGQSVTGNAFSGGLDVSYEVDLFGRLLRSVAAAGADAEASAAALDLVRVTVAAETARAYADACSAGASLAVASRTLDLQQQTADLVDRQFNAGRGNGLDVSSALTQLETTRANLPPLQAARDEALFRLAVLTGKPPAQAPASAKACVVVPQVASIIPVGDGAALLARRPDVRQAERRLSAATSRIGVATASLYPSISLGGSFGQTVGRTEDIGDDYQFSFGPLISWTFPNVAAGRARVRQAGAAADAALAAFEQTNLVALQETETALSAYARSLDRRTALSRARDQGSRSADIARLRFKEGIASTLDVIDADRTLAGLEAQLATANGAVSTAQIALFKALGGGWRQPA